MKKLISIVGGIVLIAGSFFLVPILFSKPERAKDMKGKEKKVNMPTVIVENVKNATLPITVKATGSLVAKNRVELFAEVQGIFEQSSKAFKPGVYYSKGDLMLKIRGDENYANLLAQKSTLYNLITTSLPDLKIDHASAFPNWEKYVSEFDVEKPLAPLPKPTTDKEKVFIASKNIFTTYYNIKSLEIRQSKYVIRAPFSGVLTAADITPGTLVRQGQRLGEFISMGSYELEVAVTASLSQYLKVGKKVTVRNIGNHDKTWTGTVVRINGKVDRESQTVTVFLNVQGKDLKEGLYLEALIDAREEENVFELPRNLLVDRKALYVVKDGQLALTDIEPVYFKEKTAIVRGLNDGDKVMIKPLPGAHNGMPVKVLEE